MRTTVVVLLLVRFVDESTGFLAPASVEDFRADLGIGYTTASAMFLAYGVGGVVGNLAVAAGDGRSRKPLTVAGALVTACSLVVIGLAGGGATMLVGTGLTALGATCLVHGGEIAITNALSAAGREHDLERVLARGNLLAIAGDVAAPIALAGLRLAGVEWRAVFLGAALLVTAYAVALVAAHFPDPVPPPDDDTPTVPIRRQRLVWLLGLAAFATMPLDEAYLATVLAYAEAVVGWSGSEAAALGVPFVVGGVVTFTALAGTVARTPLPRLLTVGGFGLAGVMLVAASGAPGWVLVPVGLLHSLLLNALWLGQQAVVLRANPGREGRTKLVVEVLEGTSLAMVVAIGMLADRAGLRAAMVAFAAMPLLLPVIARGLSRVAPSRRVTEPAAQSPR